MQIIENHADRSKHHMSVFLRGDGSKSNLSSICHLEEVSDLGFTQQTDINQFTGEKYTRQSRSKSSLRAAEKKRSNAHHFKDELIKEDKDL